MQRLRSLFLILGCCLPLVGCSDGNHHPAPGSVPSGGDIDMAAPVGGNGAADLGAPTGGESPDLGVSVPMSLGDFTDRAAHAVCDALFRCCDDGSQAQWFGGYVGYYSKDPIIAKLADQVPPKAQLAAAECPGVVKQMFDEVPFGSWVKQVEAGRVTFDEAAAQQCLDALGRAACGADVARALWDGTCVSFNPPGGGAEQRRMFVRTQAPGASCAPVRDGEGAMYYGSCDPSQAFCCFVDPAMPKSGCTTPKADSIGTCQTAAQAGQSCREFPPPIQLCATGLDCSPADSTCQPYKTTPLMIGDDCIDANDSLLGVCQKSWCDALGTKKCQPLKPDGAACQSGDECEHGGCNDKVCGAPTLCVGRGGGDADGGAGAMPDMAHPPGGVTTVPAMNLNSPVSVVVDPQSGTLWASFDEHVVRQIDPSTGAVLQTLGTPGTAGLADSPPKFKEPAGLAVGPGGVVYVADAGNHAIRKITPGPSGATVTTLVSGGSVIQMPTDLAVDDHGDLLIGDASACAIFRYSGGAVQTVINNDDALGRPCLGTNKIYYPRGLAWDGAHKRLYVAETGADRIDVVDLGGATVTVATVAGSGTSGHDDGPAASATFDMPVGLTLDGAGGILVADESNHRIRRIALGDAATVSTVAGLDAGDVDGDLATARFDNPSDVAAAGGGVFFVADRANSKIRRLVP